MSNLVAHVGLTKLGEASAELWENDTCIAKMYTNADGTKLRIVLSELENYKQTLISPDNKMIEFTRRA